MGTAWARRRAFGCQAPPEPAPSLCQSRNRPTTTARRSGAPVPGRVVCLLADPGSNLVEISNGITTGRPSAAAPSPASKTPQRDQHVPRWLERTGPAVREDQTVDELLDHCRPRNDLLYDTK